MKYYSIINRLKFASKYYPNSIKSVYISILMSLFKSFIMCLKVGDFLRWKDMLAGGVYGRMIDLCWPYGPGTTDSMDIWVEIKVHKPNNVC